MDPPLPTPFRVDVVIVMSYARYRTIRVADVRDNEAFADPSPGRAETPLHR
jgi:hypothetical protein